MKGRIEFTDSSLSKRDRSFLRLAIKVAEASDCVHRHGAVLVRGGSVIAVGHNKWRNRNRPEVIEPGNTSVHAEIDCLSRVNNTRGADIYIARINKRGKPMLSRPCDDCAEELVKRGINHIVYTV